MHGPAMTSWLLVALCAVTGASCVLRARTAAGRQPRAEAVSEALMGFGMALMAVPALWSTGVLPPTPLAWLFAAGFGALAARELGLPGLRRSRAPSGRGRKERRHGERGGVRWSREGAGPAHLHHVVGALAMVYMALAMAAGAPASAPHGPEHHTGTSGVPLLTGALLAYFAVHVLWDGARMMPSGVVAGAPETGVGAVAAAGAGPGAGSRGACPGGVAHWGGVANGCRVAMGVGMFAMLLTL
ncbi:DUF5134 domain-containing protein [Streptomyces axinellae]|uniref:DUF5134 domain-containing protein n=1 Tax=Streptomyces axinellae TaxID=552788 RepID=A0ABP6CIK0_9ACTN